MQFLVPEARLFRLTLASLGLSEFARLETCAVQQGVRSVRHLFHALVLPECERTY